MKILSAMQMAEVDRLTTERYLIPSILLMENAGRLVAEEIWKAHPHADRESIAVLCGRGNNGGDGFVAARYLALRGAQPSILLFADPDKLKGDALTNWAIVRTMGAPIHILPTADEAKALLRKTQPPDIIVDALFGTGLSKGIGPDFRPVVDWINSAASAADAARSGKRSFVVAVDIPSGVLADAPDVPGPAVKAELTVTFSALKLAHVVPPAADFCGRVELAQIGSPVALLENPEHRLNLIGPDEVRAVVPPRARDSHKGSFGHVYVVAGSRGKGGAALMTGLAALRSGAGLATLWAPDSLQRRIAGKYPELMTEPLPETAEGTSNRSGAERVLGQLPQADVLVAGPGLTTHESTRELVVELVNRSPVPVVLDADGINSFAERAEALRNEAGQPVVITPHPGEMARLMGRKIAEVQRSRIETALDCAARLQCHVVLKGFQTVIAAPDGELFINNSGNPGMATGGTGDVLAGMVGRFVAAWRSGPTRLKDSRPRLSVYLAAAVYLHGLAGDLAAERVGMESLIATDLIDRLPDAFTRTLAL